MERPGVCTPPVAARRTRAVAAIVVLASLCSGALAACGDPAPSPVPRAQRVETTVTPDVVVDIPDGTADRIAAGEDVALVPSPWRLSVGDLIEFRNADDIGYDIGPFYVGPGTTITQEVTSGGSYSSFCSLHPTGKITVIVDT